MNELSLFTGVGGGLLGTMLLGWRCVGAVELEKYPCRVLEQRQKDGVLDDFPIWNMDIREFNRRIAQSYTGLVDVVSAGFPCQPFSSAGKRQGADDERNMWPATIECLRVVRPQYALLENVPGLISCGYFGTILGDLAESGYDARWRILSAAEVGAPHKRDRLWIVANANGCFKGWWDKQEWRPNQRDTESSRNGADWSVAHSASERRDGRDCVPAPTLTNGGIRTEGDYQQAGDVADADSERQLQPERAVENQRGWTGNEGGWSVEPDVGRVANGVACRVDRLKAIGNGQVPAVVRAVWELLT